MEVRTSFVRVYQQELENKEIGFYSKIRRVIDFIISLLSLVIVIPIILITSIFIMLESPGNPFYVQSRMGLMGKEFNLIKLRSMRTDAEKNGAQWADKNDPRITKVGRFIRKTRIDELPQIFNVLKGDMSIIGPRPERQIFVEEFVKHIPDFPKRLEVKPGLTGWAQVNGRNAITWEQKFIFDVFYVNNISFTLDLKIFLLTIKKVLKSEGINTIGVATTESFKGNDNE